MIQIKQSNEININMIGFFFLIFYDIKEMIIIDLKIYRNNLFLSNDSFTSLQIFTQ